MAASAGTGLRGEYIWRGIAWSETMPLALSNLTLYHIVIPIMAALLANRFNADCTELLKLPITITESLRSK